MSIPSCSACYKKRASFAGGKSKDFKGNSLMRAQQEHGVRMYFSLALRTAQTLRSRPGLYGLCSGNACTLHSAPSKAFPRLPTIGSQAFP
jgi:hypothetical protein